VTVAGYVSALIGRLGEVDPEALGRMQKVVGRRRARITLDDEVIDICFVAGHLDVAAATADSVVDGEGGTDRETVIALLDGRLEVTDAIMRGRLRVTGAAGDVIRMFHAIEILLDASARTPALQALAAALRMQVRERQSPRSAAPSAAQRREDELLVRLGLIGDSRSE